jgi:hypothetical protein
MAVARMWTIPHWVVVTDEMILRGWNVPTSRKKIPAIIADNPAQRIRFETVIFLVLFSPVFRFVFICSLLFEKY